MTTSRCVIPTSFPIPAGLEHKWVLVAGPFRAVIRPCGADAISLRRIQMDIDEIPDSGQGFSEQQLSNPDKFMAMVQSMELDWIEATMKHLRYLCQQQP